MVANPRAIKDFRGALLQRACTDASAARLQTALLQAFSAKAKAPQETDLAGLFSQLRGRATATSADYRSVKLRSWDGRVRPSPILDATESLAFWEAPAEM